MSLCLYYGSAETLYVKSNDSSPDVCPGQPCATLEEYIANEFMNHFSNSNFVFLSGDHYLVSTIKFCNITNVTWTGKGLLNSSTIFCHENISAINSTNFFITNLIFCFSFSEFSNYSAFAFVKSRNITFNDVSFVTKGLPGRAIQAITTSIQIYSSHFVGNGGLNGGSIMVMQESTLVMIGSYLVNNSAQHSGGAVYVSNSNVVLGNKNTFVLNVANSGGGGAICCHNCDFAIEKGNHFDSNRVELVHGGGNGGAIDVVGGNITIKGDIKFANNKATNGGGLSLLNAIATISENTTFIRNIATVKGGGIFSVNSLIKSANGVYFLRNTAEGFMPDMTACGAICLHQAQARPPVTLTNTLTPTLLHNSGPLGGAVFVKGGFSFTFTSINATNNSDGVLGAYSSSFQTKGNNVFYNNNGRGCVMINNTDALFSYRNSFTYNTGDDGAIVIVNFSFVKFEDDVIISHNHGLSGGGGGTITKSTVVFLTDSAVICDNYSDRGGGAFDVVKSTFKYLGQTQFCNNHGYSGGAINIVLGNMGSSTKVLFMNNSALTLGGAIHASGTEIRWGQSSVTFSSNCAIDGGAIYLELGAFIVLQTTMHVYSHNNIASGHGGFIYYKDSVSDIQCTSIKNVPPNSQLYSAFPTAFLQLDVHVHNNLPYYCPHVISHNDTAGKDGNFLFGGLLDRSRMKNYNYNPYTFFKNICPIEVYPQLKDGSYISSDPYRLKVCAGVDDTRNINISVHRGQLFYINVVAYSQGNVTVPTTIIAETKHSAVLKLTQNAQVINKGCSKLTFNIYSSKTDENSVENLTLYTVGPCKSFGESKQVVSIYLKPCPSAFMLSRDKCVCEERLSIYNVSCTIDDEISIVRHAGSDFWMNGTYSLTGSYEGLIICPTCPIQYCTQDEVNITLDDPDAQCQSYRSGILCGRCAANYSLMLGGLGCSKCSNAYLLLLIVFALAGMILTISLTVLRLTVSSGTLNGFIFYSNLIQVNKDILFSSGTTTPLTLFIAWMNLDFGISTCLYEGLDSYVQTWLQYAFSIYIWLLMSLIIFASKHSLVVSKMVGSNPIAVLATLLLMSYNKMLKIIIDVFSSVTLEYPGGKLEMRWMKDANVMFFHSKHLYLSIVTISVLVLVFLPYTLLLLFGQWLYRVPQDNKFGWFLKRIKPLLDSYHAPYKIKTRYWTGFLLIIRCLLYSIFSLNSLGNMNYSLMAIIVSFSILVGISWLYRGLYHSPYADGLEAMLYLNIITISAAALILSGDQKEIVSYSLISFTFIAFLIVIMYHIYKYCVINSTLYLRLISKKSPRAIQTLLLNTAEQERKEIFTNEGDEVREPLLHM